LSVRRRRPYVLTHYGTEIWHHDGKDARFRELNRRARHVIFYSEALRRRAEALAVPLPDSSVVYPPVADVFQPLPADERDRRRRALLEGGDALVLNVKRLHPLADQATLIEAMARVAERRPGARLMMAGSGPEEDALKARTRALRLDGHVRFLGLVPNDQVASLVAAADLFVLPSKLEATPTVALEALACGTPVLSADNPGGLELNGIFGDDVGLVPVGDAAALAEGLLRFLDAPRRTRPETSRVLAARFRLDGVVERHLELYREALG
jgi:glycosyltransferase involved in cell wall biosynthesis